MRTRSFKILCLILNIIKLYDLYKFYILFIRLNLELANGSIVFMNNYENF